MPISPTGEALPYSGEAGYSEAKAQNPETYAASEEVPEMAPPQAESSPTSVIDQALSGGASSGAEILVALESAGFAISQGAPAAEMLPPQGPLAGPPMGGDPMGGNPMGGGMPEILLAVGEAVDMDDKKKAKFRKEKEST